MFIDVKIPWEPGKKLGYAINRAMETVEDWVLILDHDVFLSLNPYWYDICINAIEKVGDSAGWITCSTNAIGCPLQRANFSNAQMECLFSEKFDPANMLHHFNMAEAIYREHKGTIIDITEQSIRWKLSGLFILTRRSVYDHIKDTYGLPGDKFLGWDNYYSDRLHEAGYKIYLLKDLYVYHGYKRLWKNGAWGERVDIKTELEGNK